MANKEKPAAAKNEEAGGTQAIARSLEDARQAFDHVMIAAQKAVWEAETNSQQIQEQLRAIARRTLGFASASAASAFDLAEKLARARAPHEVLSLQKKFFEAQMQLLNEQAQSLGEEARHTAENLTKPFKR